MISQIVRLTLISIGIHSYRTLNQHRKNIIMSSFSVSSDGNMTFKKYDILASKLKEISVLKGIAGLLGWDELVMLPSSSEASQCRADQKTVLSGIIFDKKTDKEIGQLLNDLKDTESSQNLNEVQLAVVRESYRNYVMDTSLPKELVTRMTQLETEGYNAWVESRKKSEFSGFAPYLQQWVDANIAKAKYIDPARPVYDVLLDEYEKGMTSARIDEIFAEVRIGLVQLIKDIKTNGTAPDAAWMKGSYDTTIQAKLCEGIALDLGFDISKGRLDVSVHPFTGGAHPTDVRMTTRFKAEDLTEGLTGAIHETGHSLYEQGRNLDPEWAGLPVSEALSMGVHESQSLLWERMVGLSRPFQTYLLPKIIKAFPESAFKHHTVEELYMGTNTISDPSLIRVESDEVTYTMHVILRYELEKGLVNGQIKVEDIPTLWNQKMEEYLGCVPPNDAKGCLQDVHWSSGAMGYFPTYSLGAMYACQIFNCAHRSIPGLDEMIANGNFSPLRQWLNENIHRKGSLYRNGDELMTAVTGEPLNVKIFLDYLRKKYSEIYKF